MRPTILFTRLTLALAFGCASLMVAEAVNRGVLAARGTPYSRAATNERMGRAVDSMAAFVPARAEGEGEGLRGVTSMLHPYSGSENYPDTGGVLRYFREEHTAGTFTVVVLGGSVAAGWSRDVAGYFRGLLEADERMRGRRVRVLQYAHAAYKQPQQVMRLAYLFSLGYRPDAVIDLDGFNEVAGGLQNAREDTHPVYPTGAVWGGVVRVVRDVDQRGLARLAEMHVLRERARGWVERALAWRLTSSSLLGRFVEGRLGALQAQRGAVQAQLVSAPNAAGHRDPQAAGPTFDASPEAVIEQCVRNWFESSLTLHAMCAARDVYYLHCLQPARDDVGAKTLTEDERMAPGGGDAWREGVERGYPALRASGADLRARGVAFEDLTRVFAEVEETVYVDACHMNTGGHDLLSEAIARAFLAGLP